MKAITILQPWASLIACGAKHYETRSWQTKHRGEIAIHAGKSTKADYVLYDKQYQNNPYYYALNEYHKTINGVLPPVPHGYIVAVANLISCWEILSLKLIDEGKYLATLLSPSYTDVPYSETRIITEQEIIFGDWAPGRFVWQLEDIKMLEQPIPAKGKQGLWNWEGDTL